MPSPNMNQAFLPWIDIAGVIGIAVGAAKVSEWLEGLLNEPAKTSISNWLKNAPNPEAKSGPSALATLIDRVFGARALSFGFFIRSCIASLIAVLLVWIIYLRVQIHFDPDFADKSLAHATGFFLICSLLTNLLPDYLSLLVTRFIIRAIATRETVIRIVALFLADFAATSVISFIATKAGSSIVLALELSAEEKTFAVADIADTISTFWSHGGNSLYNLLTFTTSPVFTVSPQLKLALIAPDSTNSLSVLFYSAFFTSIWLWIYIASALCIKALQRIIRLWQRLSKYLDIDRHPLVCVGKVSGIILAAAYAIFVTLLQFGHELKLLIGR